MAKQQIQFEGLSFDPRELGRLIAEEVTNPPGICFYPGGFKPPHKGHFKAAMDLASRNYITEVNIIISQKEKDGITPEDSLKVWMMYLEASPSPKINVRLSEATSPIQDIFNYLKTAQSGETVYVVGGDDERDDQEYLKSIQTRYPNNVKTISITEKDGKIAAPYVRGLLDTGDYESFAQTIPEAAYNKGMAPKIFKLLVPTKAQTQDGQG